MKFFKGSAEELKASAFLTLIGFMVFVSILVFLPSCKPSANTEMPAIDVSFWAGDSHDEGISRAQEEKTMKCSDPEFEQYTCLTYEDMKKIYATMLRCKDWSGNTVQIKKNPAFIKNKEIIAEKMLKRAE